MNEYLKKAADTIMSMCLDYKIGKLEEKTFVANMIMFANLCKKELKDGEGK